jgi:hypothetical protein
MAIKPILFNTEMVQAILDGRKSCTRRLVKPEPQGYFEVSEEPLYIYDTDGNQGKITPPYQPGDILYVRETWHKYIKRVGKGECCRFAEFYGYRASVANSEDADEPWRPSIHMPKEAARIWLKVTDVKVERLQEITEVQAQAEGIRGYSKDGNLYKYAVTDDWWIDFHNKHRKSFFGGTWWQDMPRTAKDAFSYLWNSTIKKSDLTCYGWNANPWVWVIEFERCKKPKGEN